jgi:hypothetical protein
MIRLFKTLIIFLFSLAIFSSCKKTNAPTDGQLVASRLRAVLGDPAGRTVYVYNYDGGQMQYSGTIAEISDDGQISITKGGETRFFNLGNLVSYSTGSTGELYLYF